MAGLGAGAKVILQVCPACCLFGSTLPGNIAHVDFTVQKSSKERAVNPLSLLFINFSKVAS